jgi:hypothetical protein
LLASQLLGYYDPETKRLSLVDRPERLPSLVERAILAHELAHALDDQHIDLLAVLGPTELTSDARLVRSALIEGSASALTNHYFAMVTRTGRIKPAEMAAWAREEMERAEALADAPRGLNEMFASYICGAAFLTKKDLVALEAMPDDREIGANLLTAVSKPPRSMEQVLHPGKYWDPAQVDEPVTIDEASVERWLTASGWSVIHRDTLGELLTAVLTEPRTFPKDLGKLMSATAWTNPGAVGWGGDRFFLVRQTTLGRSPVPAHTSDKGVWVTAWDSQREKRFVRALEEGYAPAGYAVEPVGKKVAVVFFGFTEVERQALAARLRLSRLEFSRNGKAWKP